MLPEISRSKTNYAIGVGPFIGLRSTELSWIDEKVNFFTKRFFQIQDSSGKKRWIEKSALAECIEQHLREATTSSASHFIKKGSVLRAIREAQDTFTPSASFDNLVHEILHLHQQNESRNRALTPKSSEGRRTTLRDIKRKVVEHVQRDLHIFTNTVEEIINRKHAPRKGSEIGPQKTGISVNQDTQINVPSFIAECNRLLDTYTDLSKRSLSFSDIEYGKEAKEAKELLNEGLKNLADLEEGKGTKDLFLLLQEQKTSFERCLIHFEQSLITQQQAQCSAIKNRLATMYALFPSPPLFSTSEKWKKLLAIETSPTTLENLDLYLKEMTTFETDLLIEMPIVLRQKVDEISHNDGEALLLSCDSLLHLIHNFNEALFRGNSSQPSEYDRYMREIKGIHQQLISIREVAHSAKALKDASIEYLSSLGYGRPSDLSKVTTTRQIYKNALGMLGKDLHLECKEEYLADSVELLATLDKFQTESSVWGWYPHGVWVEQKDPTDPSSRRLVTGRAWIQDTTAVSELLQNATSALSPYFLSLPEPARKKILRLLDYLHASYVRYPTVADVTDRCKEALSTTSLPASGQPSALQKITIPEDLSYQIPQETEQSIQEALTTTVSHPPAKVSSTSVNDESFSLLTLDDLTHKDWWLRNEGQDVFAMIEKNVHAIPVEEKSQDLLYALHMLIEQEMTIARHVHQKNLTFDQFETQLTNHIKILQTPGYRWWIAVAKLAGSFPPDARRKFLALKAPLLRLLEMLGKLQEPEKTFIINQLARATYTHFSGSDLPGFTVQ